MRIRMTQTMKTAGRTAVRRIQTTSGGKVHVPKRPDHAPWGQDNQSTGARGARERQSVKPRQPQKGDPGAKPGQKQHIDGLGEAMMRARETENDVSAKNRKKGVDTPPYPRLYPPHTDGDAHGDASTALL
jgi:hypothetical protein